MRNAYSDFLDREFERDEWLARRPVCDMCNEPIQEDFKYIIDSECYCRECAMDWLRDKREEIEE